MPISYGSPRSLLVGYQIQVVQESAGVTTTIDTNVRWFIGVLHHSQLYRYQNRREVHLVQ